MVALPERGRVFRAERRVRLGDVSPSQRLRFDACARYLQDIGNDDTADSGIDGSSGAWVVRRAVVDVLAPPRWQEWVQLATWCGGTGGRWAERRLSMTGDRGGRVEVSTLWVHLDPVTGQPIRLPEPFVAIYGEAAQGRRVSPRRWLDPPPPPAAAGDAGGSGGAAGPDGSDGADRVDRPDRVDGVAALERVPWTLRAVDFDVMRHVNNAAYWAAVEEVLAARPGEALRPGLDRPVRAVLEFGPGIGPDARVDLLVARGDKQLDIWFTVDGTVHATARLVPLRA
jgi:acyl-ACP thioesterase